MAHRATPNVRQNTAQDLVEKHDWTAKEAHAWAHSTADSAKEIRQWDAKNYTPAQAQVVYAIADHDPNEWRDLELPPDVTVAYVEAGFTYDETVAHETDGTRPDQASFDRLKELRQAENEEAIKQFKEDLRADSEIADLDEDWQ